MGEQLACCCFAVVEVRIVSQQHHAYFLLEYVYVRVLNRSMLLCSYLFVTVVDCTYILFIVRLLTYSSDPVEYLLDCTPSYSHSHSHFSFLYCSIYHTTGTQHHVQPAPAKRAMP